jgi:hypothetical protein
MVTLLEITISFLPVNHPPAELGCAPSSGL